MQLESYVAGRWRSGSGQGVALRDATTGEVIANATADGLDHGALLAFAREVGGPEPAGASRSTSAPRLLKALAKHLGEHKEEFYPLSYATGATKSDSWIDIDGGISTLFVYASKGTRELPNSAVYVDGALEALSKTGTFVGQHICVPLEGAAVHINAFNFPVWGMLEKLAPALARRRAGDRQARHPDRVPHRAGVPRASSTRGSCPRAPCSSSAAAVGDLFDHLTCQDVVSFTGSAGHGAQAAPASGGAGQLGALHRRDRFAQLLDPRARCRARHAGVRPLRARGRARDDREGRPEVHRHPQGHRARRARRDGARRRCARRSARSWSAIRGSSEVRMGPLASLSQRREVLEQLARLEREAEVVFGGSDKPAAARRRRRARRLHRPDAAVLPRRGRGARRARRGGLRAGVHGRAATEDLDERHRARAARRREPRGLGVQRRRCESPRAWCSGSRRFTDASSSSNRDCAKESTGHGSPLPHLVHGGPGRAGRRRGDGRHPRA